MIHYILVFVLGGFLCTLAQILIDKTNITPARILVLYVCLGVFIYAVGAYDPLFEIFGEGIALPLVGFGAVIGSGVKESILSEGVLGILKGGLTASSAGITAAILFGVLMTVFSRGKSKKL